MKYLCLTGYIKNFGVLFPYLLEEFGESRGRTAMIASAQSLGTTGTSWLAGALIARWDHRPVCLIGAVCGSGGLLLSSLAPSMPVMMLSNGFVGMSFSMGFMSTGTMIPKYFTKKRGLAVGLAGVGDGLGQAAFGPLLNHLYADLGWR